MKNSTTKQIAQAFDTVLKDAVTPFTAVRYSTPSGNDWAINDNNRQSISYTGRGVFDSYTASEISQSILVSDIKLICLQSEVTATPAIDDLINGYQVLNISQDPAKVHYSIQLRAINGQS